MIRARFRFAAFLAVLMIVGLLAPVAAEEFGGVDFPQGAASFADSVVSLNRGSEGTLGQASNALGPPDRNQHPDLDDNAVTLGNGGQLTIEFTDNVLTGSGDNAADLFIFESGDIQENVTVSLSTNGNVFFPCGQTQESQTGRIDVDACGVGRGDAIRFVRVTDIADHRFATDNSAGADIDAIGAITTLIDPPVARNDFYLGNFNADLDVNPTDGVLNNDEDPNGQTIQVVDFTQPENGTVTVNPDGSFSYTPDTDFEGIDRFTYTIENEDGAPATATVRILIGVPPGTEPEAVDDEATTDQGISVDIPVLDNDSDADGDPITIVEVTDPGNGSVQCDDTGPCTYVPDPDFCGDDSFDYTITDDDGNEDTATVTVTVVCAPDTLPDAENDQETTDEDTPVDIGLLGNDRDEDGDALDVIDYTQPDNGSVDCNPNGRCTYTPVPEFCGEDSFEYTISDDDGNEDTATVTITVNCVSDAAREDNRSPETRDDSYDVRCDEPKHVDGPGVLKNDKDPEGDNLIAKVEKQPDHGHVDMNDNGAFTYTPDPGTSGKDEFVYLAKDSNGNSTKGHVRLHIECPHVDEPGLAVAGNGGVVVSEADGGAVTVGAAGTGDNAGTAVVAEAVATETPLADPTSDDDGDGLTYEEERKGYGTDPWTWDSDGDGWGDGDEVLVNGTNPLAPETAIAPQPVAPAESAPDAAAVIDRLAGEAMPADASGDVSAVEASVDSVPAVPVFALAASAPDDPVAALAMGCAAFPDWLQAQGAYEVAGSTAADPAIVNAVDADWDGIACEEHMQP